MNVHEFLNTYLGGNKNVSTLTYDALAEMLTDYAKALQLQQTGVIRSAFAVIPDAEKLGIGNNKITAVFKHKHQAEAWARSMWKNVYIIEQVRSEHFL